jgi:deoxyribodipyrimidine photo-lyase
MTAMEQDLYGFNYGQDYPKQIVDPEKAGRHARQTLAEFRKRPDVQREADRIVRKHTNEGNMITRNMT